MIAAMLLLLADQPATAAKPPVPVVMSKDEEQKFLSALPIIMIENKAFRIFALRGLGERGMLDAAASKLTGEGWKCDVAADYTGAVTLGVFAENRTLNDVQQLVKRFGANEFGAIELKPMLFPDPSSAK